MVNCIFKFGKLCIYYKLDWNMPKNVYHIYFIFNPILPEYSCKTPPTLNNYINKLSCWYIPSRLAQSVTCLATDVSLTADSEVASSIPARPHTFVEIDHEIIFIVI